MINYPTIGVIGLGYVGLPLAVEFSKKYDTIGFDISYERISQLKDGIDKTMELSSEVLKNSALSYTDNPEEISDCNIYIVTVPTPVDSDNNPNMEALLSCSATIGKLLNKNDIVIYESTVYPGATEEVCVPVLEKNSQLKYNMDFFCGYSPERINPGDEEHNIKSIVKVTSGSTSEVAVIIDNLYKSIIEAGTHKVSSIRIAEAAKVIENIQRDVNIALINELSMLFNRLNLNTKEVLKASATKWNFLPFQPGLVGGHCIGVDPYYLTYKAKEVGYNPEMILAGRRINDSMGKYIAERTIAQMKKEGIDSSGSTIAIFGLTFKENCPDLRNTKVLSIANHLQQFNCKIIFTDLYADKDEAKNNLNIDLVPLNQISKVDSVILAVSHDGYKSISKEGWGKIIKENGFLFDVKSIFDKKYFSNTKINYWNL